MSEVEAVFKTIEANKDEALNRLCDWLRIPSISTDPAFAEDCKKAANWISDQLIDCGLESTIHPTDGHPIVLAQCKNGGENSPHVLFYGHYDVQPDVPRELWESPPFEPTIRDGKLYARGASDDKGLVASFVESLRAWKQTHGQVPANLTVLIEGEEECGSSHLVDFLKEHEQTLKGDVVVIADSALWGPDPGVPSLTYALRGLCYMEVKLHGPKSDLHSGVFGGAVANPLNELIKVLGNLFDENHRVTIPGFYDDVVELDEEEKKQWEALGFDEEEIMQSIGVDALSGEAGFNALERNWARPSCDINGIYGGYMGDGAKTVLPSFGGAKISFRLAANQDPDKIAASFKAWFEAQTPAGCKWEITDHGGAHPVMVSKDSVYVDATRKAFQQGHGQDMVLIRCGATIPVVADFKTMLGMDSLCVGYSLEDDNIHAPNEKLNIKCFNDGMRTSAALIKELAAITK